MSALAAMVAVVVIVVAVVVGEVRRPDSERDVEVPPWVRMAGAE